MSSDIRRSELPESEFPLATCGELGGMRQIYNRFAGPPGLGI
jgi:hypothetical protein